MIKKVLALYLSMYLVIGGFAAVRGAQAQEEKETYVLAALDLEAIGVSQVEARGLSDMLRSHISRLMQEGVNLKENYELIERSQMDKIFDEFELQTTGCVSDSCAVEFGKMLSADRLVFGSVSLVGSTYSISVRIVDVELSKGYQEAESTDNMPLGVIPVDAIFSPMRKVNFTVEPIYIGRETSRERLYLEVWTDGTISPADAISQSAEILTEQLSPFVNYARLSQIEAEQEPSGLAISEELYNMPVEQMNLSVRTLNCLRRGGIAMVGELISKEEKDLMNLRNFGQKSNREIKDRLEGLGLSLAPHDREGDEEDESTEPEEAVI